MGSNETIRCDHCERIIRATYSVEEMPIDFSTGNAGESAVLCKECFYFVCHSPNFRMTGLLGGTVIVSKTTKLDAVSAAIDAGMKGAKS